MADLKISIDTSGVKSGERVIKRSFSDIKKSASDLVKTTNLIEKGFKEIGNGAKGTNELTKAIKSADDAQKNFNKAVNSNAFNKGNSSLKGLRKEYDKTKSSIKSTNIALGAFAGIIASKIASLLIEQSSRLVEYSDAWLRASNSIKVFLKSFQNTGAIRDQLVNLSLATRTELDAQIKLYNRLILVQDDLGVSSAQIFKVIEGVSKSLGVTSTSALEARGSLIQLSQAFGQEIVRAEEINSILEGTPRIAKAAAEGLNITKGELRSLIKEGLISSKQFFLGLESQVDKLNEEFNNVQITINQGITNFRTGIISLVGTVGQLTGISSSIGRFFDFLGKELNRFAKSITPVDNKLKDLIEKRFKILQEKNIIKFKTEIVLEGTDFISDLQDKLDKLSSKVGLKELQIQNASQDPLSLKRRGEELEALIKERNELIILIQKETLVQKEAKKLKEEEIRKNEEILKQEQEKVKRALENLKIRQEENKVSKEASKEAKRLKELTDPLLENIKEGARAQKILNKLKREGKADLKDYSDIVEELSVRINLASASEQRYFELTGESSKKSVDGVAALIEKLKELDKKYQDTIDANKKTEKERIKSLEKQKKEYDEFLKSVEKETETVFKDIFKGNIDSFEDFTDRMLDMFLDMLAKMAAEAIAEPIIVPIVQSIGSSFGLNIPTAPGTGALTGEGGGFGIGSIFSGAKSLYGLFTGSTSSAVTSALSTGTMGSLGSSIFGADAWLGMSSGVSAATGATVGTTGIAGAIGAAAPFLGLAAMAIPLISSLFEDDPDPYIGIKGHRDFATNSDKYRFGVWTQDVDNQQYEQGFVDYFDARIKSVDDQLNLSLARVFRRSHIDTGWIDLEPYQDNPEGLLKHLDSEMFKALLGGGQLLPEMGLGGLKGFDMDFFQRLSPNGDVWEGFTAFGKVVESNEYFVRHLTRQMERFGESATVAYDNLAIITNLADQAQATNRSIVRSSFDQTLTGLIDQWSSLIDTLREAHVTTNELNRVQRQRNMVLGSEITGLTGTTLHSIITSGENVSDALSKSLWSAFSSVTTESIMSEYIKPLNRAIGQVVSDADGNLATVFEAIPNILSNFDSEGLTAEILAAQEAFNELMGIQAADPINDLVEAEETLSKARLNAVDTIEELIRKLEGGSLAPVQSFEYFEDQYSNLLSKTFSSGSGDELTSNTSDFASFVPDFLGIAQSYGGNYQSFYNSVMDDIADIQDFIPTFGYISPTEGNEAAGLTPDMRAFIESLPGLDFNTSTTLNVDREAILALLRDGHITLHNTDEETHEAVRRETA
jgi:tape measure domain-containing protein